jgi:hypothetical protein
MTYLKKRGDKWLITIRFRQQSVDKPNKWVSKSKTFDSKIEAMVWAEKTERDLKYGESHHILTKESFEDLARIYLKQVTKVKKGAANEKIVIERLLREDWVKLRISQLTTGHLCEYRDKRPKTLKPVTFKREWSMIRSIARHSQL